MAGAVTRDDWTLDESMATDIEELMSWFPEADDILIWGGPTFRYPFTRTTFFDDIYWGRLASFSLRDPASALAAFGQVYERTSRIHFARLVVNPAQRGCGVGKRLLDMLMTASRDLFPCDEFSLFVYRENVPAYECYKSMGFVVREYPDGVPHADVCDYLTRPVRDSKKEGENHDE